MNGKAIHKHLRKIYDPKAQPSLYNNPEKAARSTANRKANRKAKNRPSYTQDEKKRLLKSVELKESELAELKTEYKELKKDCVDCAKTIGAITRNKKVFDAIPENIREEFERFLEVY